MLDVEARPYDSRYPVLCRDEQPIQLLKAIRTPIAGTKKHPRRVDDEYERAGTASIFMFCFLPGIGTPILPLAAASNSSGRKCITHRSRRVPRRYTLHLGEGFHINWLQADQVHLAEVDADHWKTWVHQRLKTPLGGAGAMTFFMASVQEHLALAKHLTAEEKTEEFLPGKGLVTKWRRLRRANHWLDCLYNASAAGHLCGVRLIRDPPPPPARRVSTYEGRCREDGRPWIDVERWWQIDRR